jgi:hypothetical protein
MVLRQENILAMRRWFVPLALPFSARKLEMPLRYGVRIDPKSWNVTGLIFTAGQ